MKTPNLVSGSDGKSRMNAQRYISMAAALLRKETPKKRSYSMSQDEGNDQSKGSTKFGNTPESHKVGCKRQRVALVTERETCSRDGPITPGHLRHSIVKDVNTRESSRGAQVDDGSLARNKKEGKLCAKKDVCAQELPRSAQGDSSLTSSEKEEEKFCGKKDGVEGSPQAPTAGSSNLRLVEYWVPAQLSNAQLEQYFSTLIANSDLLSSRSKKGSHEHLRGVLVALRKCCDHPYVLDPSLQSSLKDRSPLRDYLSIGIETSGKLQLLSKLLAKIREQGLGVLIVYKTIDTLKKGTGIGYILDDVIHQSFGEESYVHIFSQSRVNPRGRQAAVDLSNERTGGRFIILTEYSSSSVSIRLSSADVVILFNGDWNPVNDIRALQRMKIHTECDNLRVFRLYSVYTLEEKVLCLARDGAAANGRMRNLSWSVCHSLIAWGAAHLYERLDILHETAAFGSTKSSEDDFVSGVMHELTNLLSSKSDDFDISHSIISKANWVDEMYCGNIKLHGEREVHSSDDVPSYVFWPSLLDGLRPHWIFLPEKSEKRRVLSCQRPSGIPEGEMRAVFPLPEGTRHNTKRRKMVPRPTGETLSHQERLGLTALVVAMRRTSCKKAGESKCIKSISSQSSASLGQEAKETGSSCQQGKSKLDDKFKLELRELCREMDERWVNLRAADLSTRNDIEEQGLTVSESLECPTGSLHEEPDDTLMNASPALTDDQMPTLSAEKCSPVPPVEGLIPVDSADEQMRSTSVPAIADEPTLSGSSSVKQSDNLSAALTLENPNVSPVSSPPLVDVPCTLAVNENQECGTQCAKNGGIPGDVVGLFQDDDETREIPDAIPIGESEVAEYLSEEAPGNQYEKASRMHGAVSCAGSSPNCVTDQDCGVQGSLNEGTADGELRQQFPADFSMDLSYSGLNGLTPGQMLLQHCTDQGSQLPFEKSPGVHSHVSEDILCSLQGEVERLQNAEAEATKKHEDMVWQLESDRHREAALVSEKYDRLLQGAKNDLTQKEKELQARHEKINAHKALFWSWRLVADEDSPIGKMFIPPSLVQSAGLASSNGVQTNSPFHSPQIVSRFSNLISTNPVARRPYSPMYHSPTGFPAGLTPPCLNPYLSSYIQSCVFNPHRFNQQALNLYPSGSHTQQLTNLEHHPFPYGAHV